MGGRQFAQYNVADPAPVVAMFPSRPACFDAFSWRAYLLDVHRGTLNDPVNRQRLIRGELPNFCAECCIGYAERMSALGRCHPHPNPAETNSHATEGNHGSAQD